MKAAELIWNSWKSGNKIKSIPSKLAPQNRLEAYKIQENLEALSKSEMLGWKIAATSLDGQNHIGVNGPLAGRILSNKTFKPPKPRGCQITSIIISASRTASNSIEAPLDIAGEITCTVFHTS